MGNRLSATRMGQRGDFCGGFGLLNNGLRLCAIGNAVVGVVSSTAGGGAGRADKLDAIVLAFGA